MRIACSLIVAALALAPEALRAQGPREAPPYQRTRRGADLGPNRGNAGHWRGSPSYGGYGGIYDPYFAPAPIIAGSYYQRPYPYHFDYYRYRWGGQAPQQAQPSAWAPVEMIPAAECPCLAPANETATGPALN